MKKIIVLSTLVLFGLYVWSNLPQTLILEQHNTAIQQQARTLDF